GDLLALALDQRRRGDGLWRRSDLTAREDSRQRVGSRGRRALVLLDVDLESAVGAEFEGRLERRPASAAPRPDSRTARVTELLTRYQLDAARDAAHTWAVCRPTSQVNGRQESGRPNAGLTWRGWGDVRPETQARRKVTPRPQDAKQSSAGSRCVAQPSSTMEEFSAG